MADFINPYNFMPLGKQSRYRTQRREQTYSGVIHYSLLTKTPLFIPNTSVSHAFSEPAVDENKDHKSYDFYSYTDLSGRENDCKDAMQPVIPGSSVRGLLRTQYEILTDSCMQVLEDSPQLRMGKRTAEIFQAGLLRWEENGTLELYWAEDCLMRTQGAHSLKDDTSGFWAKSPKGVPASADQMEHWNRQCYVQQDLQEGQRVYFAYTDRGYRIKPLALQVRAKKEYASDTVGYVMKGEAGPDMHDQPENKHCCHIFTANGRWSKVKKNSSLETEELDTLCENIKAYQKNTEGSYQEYGKNYAAFWKAKVEGSCFPVYFSYIKELDYVILSPAARTREIYRNNIRSLAGSHVKCTDKEHLCPACQLFGTLGKGFGRASNIRFTDLTLERWDAEDYNDLYEKPVTLRELSSPKLSNMEFYLKRPAANAWFWTYDYYIDQSGTVHSITPELNGRKFYWHNLRMKLENIQSEPNLRNVTVRPLKDKVTFTGKIFFDQISKEELDLLIFVVNAGDEKCLEEKTHGYKLGMGKPLGLGSVALSVDQVLIHKRKLDHENRTVKMTDQPYEEYVMPELKNDHTPNLTAQFEKMTSFYLPELADADITYPRDLSSEKPEEQIFKWFTEYNHRAYRERKREGDRVINKSPNSRTQQFYVQYLQALSPKLCSTGALETINPPKTNNLRASAGRSGIEAIWMAPYGIYPSQRAKLPKIGAQSIYYRQLDKEWATEEKLRKASANYRVVLLPAKTRKDLVHLAMELFDHVVISKTGADGRDDGWELKHRTV